MNGDRERFLAAGMDDYLTKPLRMTELIESLRRCSQLDIEQSPSAPTNKDPDRS